MRPLAQALAAGAASAACFCAGDALAAAAAASGFPACDAPVLLSAIPETGLAAEPMALAVGLMAACIPWAVWARSLVRAGTYRQGEEHGSARWGTLKEGRAFMDRKDKANNILLSRDFALALKPKRFDLKHDRNRNVCVLGGPGSGKTRYYVKPNLMQANADFLVTDPKGTLLGDVGWMLEDAGYDIRTFDTTDFSRSMHYNPLSYVKDQADILVFVECLIKNTTPDDRKGSDPFWENSERLLYTALVAYLVYHARPEERDLNSLMLLLSLAEAREEDESYMSPLDLIFEELETGMRFMERGRGREAREERPFDDGGDWGWVRIAEPRDPEEDFALSTYRAFKVAAGKTLKSIIISCNVRLKPLSVDAVSDLVAYDEMALDSLGSGEGSHAIFASMSDSDSTFDFLFALLMWQATSVLAQAPRALPARRVRQHRHGARLRARHRHGPLAQRELQHHPAVGQPARARLQEGGREDHPGLLRHRGVSRRQVDRDQRDDLQDGRQADREGAHGKRLEGREPLHHPELQRDRTRPHDARRGGKAPARRVDRAHQRDLPPEGREVPHRGASLLSRGGPRACGREARGAFRLQGVPGKERR